MSRTWWLNLDAERELAEPSARATPSRLLEQMAEHARRFAPSLCLDDPYVLPEGRRDPPGLAGPLLIWCPTPGALHAAGAAGYRAPKAPTLAVLQRVNDRRFAWELGRSDVVRDVVDRLQGRYPSSREFEARRWPCLTAADALARCATAHGAVGPVRLKRRFGFAGKGQRRVGGWPDSSPDPETERWLQGAAGRGGFLLEPEVEIDVEVSTHGLVTEEQLLLGEPCLQRCDSFGAPLSIERAEPGSLPELLDEGVRAAARAVGSALRDGGYFGPFGIDSRTFRWRGEPGVHLIGDLNARFTMGWSTGMGPLRESALQLLVDRTYGTCQRR